MSAHVAQHHHIRLPMLVALLLTICGPRVIASQESAPLSSLAVRRAADTSTQLRVVVSLAERRLWVIDSSGDTLRAAPVAVGSGRRLSLGGRTWRFATPVGIRRILSTEVDPVWIRPDWAYVELARQRKLRLDSVTARLPRALADGDSLVARAAGIGIVKDGAFEAWPFTQDIVIRGVLYMPPAGSPYRMVAGALGKHRLNLGSSVGFHGTLEKESIGRAVTHGCMRLHDEDVEWLYLHVPVGTPVFIY